MGARFPAFPDIKDAAVTPLFLDSHLPNPEMPRGNCSQRHSGSLTNAPEVLTCLWHLLGRRSARLDCVHCLARPLNSALLLADSLVADLENLALKFLGSLWPWIALRRG